MSIWRRLYSVGRCNFGWNSINRDFGDVWGNKYDNKDYGTDNFDTIEAIYRDTKDMAVNLSDISNISIRLNDYVGKINPNMRKTTLGFQAPFI